MVCFSSKIFVYFLLWELLHWMGGLAIRDFFSPASLTDAERKSVLDGEPTLEKIAERIRSGDIKRIVVMSGAGTSVAAGVPDFRSPNTGLYSQLRDLGLPFPEAVFSIDYFKQNPFPFYRLVRKFFPGTFHPTDAHFFVTLLQKKNILLRQYTQNIDTLELLAGVRPENLVEAHGSFADVKCTECGRRYPIRWFRDALYSDLDGLRCSELARRYERGEGPSSSENSGSLPENVTQAETGVASSGEGALGKHPDASSCRGFVKPGITFFGENLPHRFWHMAPNDLKEADLLIVLGTSLQVYPFAEMINTVSPRCPRLLINKEPVKLSDGSSPGFRFHRDDNYRDVFLQADCDEGIHKLCKLLNWEPELESLRQHYASYPKEDLWKILEDLQKVATPHIKPLARLMPLEKHSHGGNDTSGSPVPNASGAYGNHNSASSRSSSRPTSHDSPDAPSGGLRRGERHAVARDHMSGCIDAHYAPPDDIHAERDAGY